MVSPDRSPVMARRDRIIDHTGIGVADVARAATFYDAALGALGSAGSCRSLRTTALTGLATVWNTRSSGSIVSPSRGKAAHRIRSAEREEVDAFHAAALKATGMESITERRVSRGC
jgi:catechol 2,3-dioxygenase-like lactoylglutathione lyase family enzyme